MGTHAAAQDIHHAYELFKLCEYVEQKYHAP
jgi:hypothetical protein